ncbi:MAG: hypothetical protein KA314_26930 [Chloroflexi bacterium]|nr:hypothetical protein [Chloroflexota bacterium]MBP8059487.1 hypothetical protein [Chloroflexota bacterium]
MTTKAIILTPIFLFVFMLSACQDNSITNQPTIAATAVAGLPIPPTPAPIITSTPGAETSAVIGVGPVTPTATPIPDGWKLYRNITYNFEFIYPAIFDEEPYAACALRETPGDDLTYALRVSWGLRSEILVRDGRINQIDFFVNELLGRVNSAEVGETTLGIYAEERIPVDYRSHGTNAFGHTTFIKRGNFLFEVGFAAGDFCPVPDPTLLEPTVLERVLASFAFME